MTLRPATLLDSKGIEKRSDESFPCYHGDISPYNVVCESDSEDINTTFFKLIDWGTSLRLHRITHSYGWNSPEAVELNKTYPDDATRRAFNRKYASKKDAWAFALLAGSILRGGFFVHVESRARLPNFEFIKNKMKFLHTATFDESLLDTLTQKEVDGELEKIKEGLDPSHKKERLRLAWWNSISQWLTVDPDLRPNLAQHSVVYKKP